MRRAAKLNRRVKHLAILALMTTLGCSAATPTPPERPRIIVESIHCYILKQVRFGKDSSTLSADASSIVDELAFSMRNDPDQFVLIELSGHASPDETDSRALADRRAQAVQAALVARGIDATRARARSYGDKCPMRSEDTDPQAVDRRVETRVIRTKDGDTGAVTGCAAALSP